MDKLERDYSRDELTHLRIFSSMSCLVVSLVYTLLYSSGPPLAPNPNQVPVCTISGQNFSAGRVVRLSDSVVCVPVASVW